MESGKLDTFERHRMQALGELFPGIEDSGRLQAKLRPKDGGLGWYGATDVAYSAALASIIVHGPRIKTLINTLELVGLHRGDVLRQLLDDRTAIVTQKFMMGVAQQHRATAEAYVRTLSEAAKSDWAALLDGTQRVEAPSLSTLSGLDEPDDELPDNPAGEASIVRARGLKSAGAQRELYRIWSMSRRQELISRLEEQGREKQVTRLKELAHKSVDTGWLFAGPHNGNELPEHKYVAAVQKRLGCKLLTEPAPCACCEQQMDVYMEHSECCAKGEATKGHYRVVRGLMRGFALADTQAETEVLGLVDGTDRPADILTTAAAPSGSAALDVSITSPNRGDAGEDAAQTAYIRKIRRYRRHLKQLSQQNITFRPLIWTADGRAHPAVTRTMHYALSMIRRSRPGTSPIDFMRRWNAEIAIALQDRRASMMLACCPRAPQGELWMCRGGAIPEGAIEEPDDQDWQGPDYNLDDWEK